MTELIIRQCADVSTHRPHVWDAPYSQDGIQLREKAQCLGIRESVLNPQTKPHHIVHTIKADEQYAILVQWTDTWGYVTLYENVGNSIQAALVLADTLNKRGG